MAALVGAVLFVLCDYMRSGSGLASAIAVVVLYAPAASFALLPPWILIDWMARRLKMQGMAYYAAAGLLTGSVYGPAFLAAGEDAFDSSYGDRFAQYVIGLGPQFALMGLTAGLCFWAVMHQRLRT
ncbi:MAG: hypothetical protein ACRYGM_17310 [Janthinobacterium lividum]